MMSHRIICITLLVTVASSTVLWHDGYETAVSLDGECKGHYSCASCSQVRICRTTDKGLKETFRLFCNGSKPYCDNATGTCTATPSTECADTGKITCLRDGVFPDLERCDEYHICQQGRSKTFKCMEGEVFDGHMCSEGSFCQKFDCINLSGTKVPHPNNPNVFAYCLHGRPLFVDKCGEHQELHPESQMCYSEEKTSTMLQTSTPPSTTSTIWW